MCISFNHCKEKEIYRVGPHLFRITHSSEWETEKLLPSLSPFKVTDANSQGETLLFELRFEIGQQNLPLSSLLESSYKKVTFVWEDASCTIIRTDKDRHCILITPTGSDETYRMWCEKHFKRCSIELSGYPCSSRDIERNRKRLFFAVNNFIMMLYAFNGARRGTLLVHASVVVHGGKGYLFLGKSGTGKSTHSRLWLEQFADCRLLNDDNPVVHVGNSPAGGGYENEFGDTITVYGSPWSGKTPCYLPESAPIGAIVRLEQAAINEIVRKKGVYAFASFLPSCSCLRQDKEIYTGILSAVTEVVSHIPVFLLNCLPNREAAELCRKAVVDSK